MLKCVKDVGVRSSHFVNRPSEPVVSVKVGDVVDIKDASVDILLNTGYFVVDEKKAPKAKKEEVIFEELEAEPEAEPEEIKE